MIAVLAVLFGSLAALAGALATVGWQRAAQAEARGRRGGRSREALAELATRPPGDTLVSSSSFSSSSPSRSG